MAVRAIAGWGSVEAVAAAEAMVVPEAASLVWVMKVHCQKAEGADRAAAVYPGKELMAAGPEKAENFERN